MVDKIEGATIVIGGDSRPAERAIDNIGEKLEGLEKLAGAVAVAFAAFEVGQAFANYIKGVDTAIEESLKLSRTLNTTVVDIQDLRRAADLTGVAFDSMTEAGKSLISALSENGKTDEVVASLQKLHLTAEQLNDLTLDQRFAAISAAMKEASLSAQEQRDILTSLGVTQADLVVALQMGSNAFGDAEKDVRSYGIALSDVDATQVEQVGQAMSGLGKVSEGVGNQLAVAFAPIIRQLALDFTDLTKTTVNFGELFQKYVDLEIVAIGRVADYVALWGLAFQKVKDVVVSVLTEIYDDIAAVATGMANLLNMIPGFSTGIGAVGDSAKEAFGAAAESAGAAAKAMNDSIKQELGGEWP